jgi:dTDP-glucose 4,6-dehydratase
MRALITGAGGSIGCHVLRHLLANTDWDIVCLDSFRHKGLTDRIERVTVKHPETRDRLHVFTHDLQAPLSPMLVKRIGHVDYILNLAAMSDVDASLEHPYFNIRANCEIMLSVLEYARIVKPKAFLHVSTDEVYGPSDGTQFHKEWDAFVPSNPYSSSKAAQEMFACGYWRAYQIPLIIVNLMNNYGEMQSTAKFPAICIRKIMQGETVTIHGSPDAIGSRFYIHSRNAADAMLFLLRKTMPYLHEEGEVDRPDRYNVVGSACVTNLDFAKLVAKYLDKPLFYNWSDFKAARPGHDRSYGLDGTKLHDLGWYPPISFEESLQNTVAWYQRNKSWLDL